MPRQADLIIKIPAQTMKDQLGQRTSIQPMGTLFEQAQLFVLEMVVTMEVSRTVQTILLGAKRLLFCYREFSWRRKEKFVK
jgi:D-arabinose 5-phosphate isomerase GutQ